MARAQGQARARSVWTDVSNSGLPFLSAWFVCVLVKVEGAERPLFLCLDFLVCSGSLFMVSFI